jgi:hypothetical protein
MVFPKEVTCDAWPFPRTWSWSGKQQAQVKLVIGGTRGDNAIKTAKSVSEDLDFVDSILYPE